MSEPSVKITLIQNGPAKVECDEAAITMWNGDVVTKKGRFSLCRCGASKNKPFCDGAHKECGFEG